jgi:hypothetical protein
MTVANLTTTSFNASNANTDLHNVRRMGTVVISVCAAVMVLYNNQPTLKCGFIALKRFVYVKVAQQLQSCKMNNEFGR